MSERPKDQISQWLKKLEQESWQLELLVSAFTIFLLLQAIGIFSDLLEGVQYEYDLSDSFLSFLFVFFALLNLSIKALTMFLILHLLLRGFWIGTIGLRSVQSEIDFDKLNYSEFFTDKLKRKVISLDNLAMMLDEICSLIFSFAFLIMSVLLAFGMYLLFLGVTMVIVSSVADLASGLMSVIITGISAFIVFLVLITGLIYLIDYFTLGFFKKFRFTSKLYYPFYRFYGWITLSVISKSIYYYLISKFSKKRIRLVYLVAGVVILLTYLTEFDQYQYYPNKGSELNLITNQYDNMRPSDNYIAGVSIQSNLVSEGFIPLFIRYDSRDNELVKSNCPELIPAKQEGLNWSMSFIFKDGNLLLTDQNFEGEDKSELLRCLGSIYQLSINDSILSDIKYYYIRHPSNRQRGLYTMVSTNGLLKGENILRVRKKSIDHDGLEVINDFAHIPFWFQ